MLAHRGRKASKQPARQRKPRRHRGTLAARNQIVVEYLGLVAKALVQIGRPGDADLFQEGAIKLMRAAEMYDTSRGVKFSTYATRAIKNGLIDAMVRDTLVRVPRAIGRRGGILRAQRLTDAVLALGQ